jgi:hypothetical protein
MLPDGHTTSTAKCHYYEKPPTVPVASRCLCIEKEKARSEERETERKRGREEREIENENDRLGGAKASTRKPHVH